MGRRGGGTTASGAKARAGSAASAAPAPSGGGAAPIPTTNAATAEALAKAPRLVASRGVLRSADEKMIGVGATLILCPMSLLAQWSEELATRGGCREGSSGGVNGLQLIIYYGMQRAELPPLMSPRHVVLTSYGTVASEWAALSSAAHQPGGAAGSTAARRKSGAGGAAGGKTGGGGGLHRVLWRRLVLDEAHEIKNPSSLTARAVFALKAERRWALTGSAPPTI